MKKNQSKVRYFTRNLLIEASRLGLEWDFNRQISEQIAEVPDRKYPVIFTLDHHHRHGQRCEPHVRCVISLEPFTDGTVICDVPSDFFEKLPTMRLKKRVAKRIASIR
ncbi:MAG: hypothetical protein AB7I37_17680 [Pirellulales bacterium]